MKKNISRQLLAALVLNLVVLTLATGMARAQYLRDGGFESPALSTNYSVFETGTPDFFWTPTGLVDVNSNNYNLLGNTPFGVQYLELGPTASISQTVDGFIAGQTYVLGLDFSDLSGGTTPQISIAISGAASQNETLTATVEGGTPNYGFIDFQSGVLIFTAETSGSGTISITDIGDTLLAVDNVGLYGKFQTAPEPAAALEFLLALGALGSLAMARRLGFWKA